MGKGKPTARAVAPNTAMARMSFHETLIQYRTKSIASRMVGKPLADWEVLPLSAPWSLASRDSRRRSRRSWKGRDILGSRYVALIRKGKVNIFEDEIYLVAKHHTENASPRPARRYAAGGRVTLGGDFGKEKVWRTQMVEVLKRPGLES